MDAAHAIAAGWKRSRPTDSIRLFPMSDGGDGFGEIIAAACCAKTQRAETINAAGEKIKSIWWWNSDSCIAIIESAKIIGLAMLPPGRFHPFQLDTFGLGKILQAAARKGTKTCYIGIGGSATNDAGFGMARALGWRFLDKSGEEIHRWTDLHSLQEIVPPPTKRRLFAKTIVAVDVTNPLLGPRGCTRIYGPQKGLKPEDFHKAESALKRLAAVARKTFGKDYAKIPGAGAAGGLGFAFMAFLGATPKSGFDIFARNTRLEAHLKKADLVITGEGALDKQTLMGKGVGQIALLCRKHNVPCLALAGVVTEPEKARKLFTETGALVNITTEVNAKAHPAKYLRLLAAAKASGYPRLWNSAG